MMGELHLLRPFWLVALLPLTLVLWRMWRSKSENQSWKAVCDPRLLRYLLVGETIRSKQWPLLVAAIAGILTILALTGPVWKKLPQPVLREHSALVVALDLSRSMNAADLRPSRLQRARLKLLDLLQMRREGQTALLVYAAEPFVVTPLTDDAKTIASQVTSLSTSIMPSQGSRTDRALLKAQQLLQNAGVPHGDILLITDEVDNKQSTSALQKVVSAGHRVSVLGIGTRDGAPIPKPEGGFFKNSAGDIIIVKLQKESLRQIAQAGKGRYHHLSVDDSDLEYLLNGVQTRPAQNNETEQELTTDIWHEEGPWLLLLVLPLVALVFRRGLLLLLLVAMLPMPEPAQALEWDDLWSNRDQQAARLLEQGNSSAAAKQFQDPQWKSSAHYRAGEYQESIKALEGIDSPDSWYNRGNALAHSGKLPDAVQAYKKVLEHKPDHADAMYNKKLVEDALKQQQQQNKSDQGKSGEQSQQNQQQPQAQDAAGKQKPDQKDSAQQSAQNKQQAEKGKPKNEQSDSAKAQPEGNQEKGRTPEEQQGMAEQNEPPPEQDAEQQADASLTQESEAKESEADQAVEQWLRRIPDDPGGLLRRKFRYQYQRQQQPQPESKQW